MDIKQFEDSNLSHYSYAISSNGQMAVVDPGRNPLPYYEYARQINARITAIIETHPHADFISGHLEMHKNTGAPIYVSKWVKAAYPHQSFDEGQSITIGDVKLLALNTPGHSPDSISILLEDENGVQRAIFSGDTLFIGDCGRPDLRESAGAITSTREELARNMYHSLRNKFIPLPDEVQVFPAHGAGSLCGKGLSSQNSSTMGAEKMGNWSLQRMTEDDFVKELLADQPFVPKYFPYAVDINKTGAQDYTSATTTIKSGKPINTADDAKELDRNILVVDTRSQDLFKRSHLNNSINLMDGKKFETWLGSIVGPGEKFYLATESQEMIEALIPRIAAIGYEDQVELAFELDYGENSMEFFDSDELRNNANSYTIIDVRNPAEVNQRKIFPAAVHIPLYELRERIDEVPEGKPVVVHCAAGYRSAAASSILESRVKSKVYDLGDEISRFVD